MEPIIPDIVQDLSENVQFRATVQGDPGQEIIDCRLWAKKESGEWVTNNESIQIHCTRLMHLQREYDKAVKEAVARGEARLQEIKAAYEEEMRQAQVLGEKSVQEFHLIAQLVNQAAETLVKITNEGI